MNSNNTMPTVSAVEQVTFDHVSLAVNDVEPGIAWYGDKFGARIVDRWQDTEKGMEWVHLAIGDFMIELVRMPGLPVSTERRAGYHHFCLTVADCDATVTRLQEQGVTVMFPPADFDRHNNRWSFIRDGYGNVIEIMSLRKAA